MDFIEILKSFFQETHIEKNHSIEHSIRVRNNVFHFLSCDTLFNLTESQKLSLEYAALLHDVDDRKFFPEHKNYENARKLLQEKVNINIEEVIKIISLVSFTDNGIEENENYKWMYIVRYCDRLESIGEIGILRSYTYSIYINRPLFTKDTPKIYSIQEIDQIIMERYPLFLQRKYSESMMDYFYDKLFIVSEELVKNKNKFISKEARRRKKILEDFIIFFSNHSRVDMTYISKLEEEYESDNIHSFVNI